MTKVGILAEYLAFEKTLCDTLSIALNLVKTPRVKFSSSFRASSAHDLHAGRESIEGLLVFFARLPDDFRG